MGVCAGLYMYVVVVQKFTFAISSPDEFLLSYDKILKIDIFENFINWKIRKFQNFILKLQTDCMYSVTNSILFFCNFMKSYFFKKFQIFEIFENIKTSF